MSDERPVHRVIHLAEATSTNSEAMARALAGESLPFWVRADQQTAGKGRSGRTWVSTTGNLYTSLATAVGVDQRRATQLALVAGVGVHDAICRLACEQSSADIGSVRLKWPNDIMAGEAKLGGILIETTYDFRRGGLIAVIGIGLNVVSGPELDRKTTCLAARGLCLTARGLQSGLADAMDQALGVWDGGQGFGEIRARWLKAAMPVGSRMTIHAGEGVAEGQFDGLDDEGALLLRDKTGRVSRFVFGDVTLQSSVTD